MRKFLLLAASVAVAAGAAAAEPVTFTEKDFERNLVIEEGTGTWCAWCVAGTAMCDYVNETYPDRFYCISCHNNDKMAIDAYQDFIYNWIHGFPYSWTNRKDAHGPSVRQTYETNKKFIDDVYAKYTAKPAICAIALNVELIEDAAAANVTAYTAFSADTDRQYTLSFVVTEDHVGPYNQKNAYAGGANGSMGGWEKKDFEVSTYFDDVARAYVEYPGIEGSLPAKITKDEVMTYTARVPLDKVEGEKFRIIGWVADAETNEIVNVRRVEVSTAGVGEILADRQQPLAITVAHGTITVAGADNFQVYTLAGIPVAPHGLDRGTYIVRANGQSRKVALK